MPENNLATLLMAEGRHAEAEVLFRRAIAIRPPRHPELARAEVTLGTCLTTLGRYEEAETILRQAHAALTAQLPADDERMREAGEALVRLGGRKAFRSSESSDLTGHCTESTLTSPCAP